MPRGGHASIGQDGAAAARASDGSENVPQDDGHITILLATYNGERYLDQLLQSLLSQTYQDFVVLARDDCSTDRTRAILDRWSARYPGKVRVVSDDRGNLRSLANFSLLMELCDTQYFTFCDQDDVWIPEKLQLSVAAIRRLESEVGNAVPILVHSDLKIVDHNLWEVSKSYFAHKSIHITHARRLEQLLVNNIVAGCTLMGNRALLELGRPIPQAFPYHDWWLALVATSCGILQTITIPTVLYRQHAENQVGAGRYQKQSPLWDARHVLQQPKLLALRMAKALRLVRSYAVVLLRAVGDRMPDHNRDLVQAFCLPLLGDEIAEMPWPRRVWLFVRFLELQVRLFPQVLRWCY